MPWSFPGNIPKVAKNWTAAEQKKCISAANAVLRDGGSEQSAIFACIRNAGKTKEEIVKAVDAVLVASNRPLEILEETTEGLKVSGVALVDEAISSNRRYYSAKFNDACMEATNQYMAEGGTVTIFSRHGNAVGQGGQMPTALPIGKVTAPLYRKGKEIWYNMFIAPTTEGRDVITLVKAEVMLATSIRAAAYKSRMRRMNGADVEELIEATIVGIDTTDEAGIRGAGIREVLEEAPQFEEEEDMDYEKLTMEELLEHRKDLLDAHAASVQEAMQVKVDEAEAERVKAAGLLEERVNENAAFSESISAAGIKIDELGLKLKIAEAANFGGMAGLVLEELTEKVTCEEDIPKYLKEAKDKAMTAILGQASSGTAKGVTEFVEEPKEPELTEEFRTILKNCQKGA